MLSVFAPEKVAEVAPHVDSFKVASCEFMYEDLYTEMEKYGKTIYASMGAHTLEEVDIVMKRHPPDVLLYCVVEYPARHHDVRHIPKLRELYQNTVIGFSDHSRDLFTAPVAAKLLGAEVLEKHFRLERITDTPDAEHALTEREFLYMTFALNSNLCDTSQFQQEALDKHKRRLKCKAHIKAGEPFTRQNVGCFRSLDSDREAAHVLLLPKVLGRSASRDYAPGEGISPVECT
jgi:sialic acid synthase SpsE